VSLTPHQQLILIPNEVMIIMQTLLLRNMVVLEGRNEREGKYTAKQDRPLIFSLSLTHAK